MTDIVERLHSYAASDHERGCQGRCYSCECGYDDKRDPLLVEAADEIECLRNALRRIDGINDNPADFNVAIEAVLRAALDHGSSTLTPPPAQTQQPE